MDYRKRLRDLRIDHDLTQQDIADVCHVSDATVGNWENGLRHIGIEHIQTLCRYYGVSADYILGLPENLSYPKRK